ncbi:GGDEF domain-containing protein [Isoptericola sp. b490]|uniref:GGDEF domain-containing protein n=1 Tax=Actinotalea lenta TaxID=3064654 RepID=UPI0027125252|nr:GGDEF domain-containing protein [Isoptericola sp. b490]MDO8120851.1 GGDEF domain-containing protein [Isoptericola sp. b490]
MHPPGVVTLLRAETRGWALSGLLTASAAVVATLAVTPLTTGSRTDRLPVVVAALALLAVAAALGRRSTAALWGVVMLAVGVDVWMLAGAATLTGAILTMSAFTYPVLYAAYAFEGAWLTAALGVTAGGSAVGLALSGAGWHWIPWSVVVAGSVVAGYLVGRVLTVLRWYGTVDALTGVLTRTAFAAMAASAIAGSRRRGAPAVLVLVDLDGFKEVNDTHGHAEGDRVLVEAVDSWRARLRGQDLLGRAGGDEFLILLPDTDLDGAREVAAGLADVSPIAFSTGVALVGPHDTVATLLRRADAAMYAVKRRR